MGYQDDFDAADKAGKTERITTERMVLEERKPFYGRYLGRDLVTGKKKGMSDSYSYRFDTDTGPVSMFLSSAFDKSHGGDMIEGAVYRIEYKGKQTISEGRTFKIYDVRRLHVEADEADAE
jgi:hypothetical protein